MKRLAWFLLLAPGACSPGTPTPDASTDGSANDATTDATLQDGGADAPADVQSDAPFDAGACPIMLLADGGPCNALMVTGSNVVPVCHTTAPPTPVGGPIYNGHYVLTKIDDYDSPTACPTQPEKIDWSICGTVWATVQVGPSTPHLNATVSAAGSTLDFTLTCPNPGTTTSTYDATSTGIVLYRPLTGADGGKAVRAETYVKM